MENYRELFESKLKFEEKEDISNLDLLIGDLTNLGIIQDKTATQYQINNQWYHKKLVKIVKEKTYEMILDELRMISGKGFIKLYHGTDSKTAKIINRLGKFGYEDGNIVFFTDSKELALDYVNMKSKNRNLDSGEVLEFNVPRWSVDLNRGSGEYESRFFFIQKGNKWIPEKNNVIKTYNKYY